jgi:hypothetical protein
VDLPWREKSGAVGWSSFCRRKAGIKRRKLAVRVFRDEVSWLSLAGAVAAEPHEDWMEGSRYLNAVLSQDQLNPMKTKLAIAA